MDSMVIFFCDIDGTMSGLAGGKGVNLGELSRAGLPVPGGFCVTTVGYEAFLGKTDLTGNTAGEARRKLKAKKLPSELEREVKDALGKYTDGTIFAVRPSVAAENVTEESFAGFHNVFLNVTADEVPIRIRDCFASLYSDPSVEYRRNNGLKNAGMAVIVQKMVPTAESGMLFTADAATGKREPVFCRKGSAARMTAEELAQVLTEEQRRRLIRLAERIEAYYRCPQQIEWVVSQSTKAAGAPGGGKVYILQSRPIYDLYPAPSAAEDGYLHVFLCLNYLLKTQRAMPRLSLEILQLLLRSGNQSFASYKPELLCASGGRLYADVSRILGNKKELELQLRLLDCTEPSLADSERAFMEKRPDAALPKPSGPIRTLGVQRISFLIRSGFQKDASEALEQAVGKVEQYAEKVQAAVKKERALRDQFRAVYETLSIVRILVPEFVNELITAAESFRILQQMEAMYSENSGYAADILDGIEGNCMTDMWLEIGDLADLTAASQVLLQEFEDPDAAGLILRLRRHDEALLMNGKNDGFYKQFMGFLERYGMRCGRELDVSQPRWREDPSGLAKSILSMAQTKTPGDHRKAYAEAVARGKTAAAALVKEIAAKDGKRKAAEAEKAIGLLRKAVPAGEYAKYAAAQALETAREVMLRAGEGMLAAGQLRDREDVFHLGFYEIYRALESGEDCRRTAAERRMELRHYGRLTPPGLITAEGEIFCGVPQKRGADAE